MFIFKKASHLDRKHYKPKCKQTKEKSKKIIETVEFDLDTKESEAIIPEDNLFTETHVKKTRASKKNAVNDEQ